jgi:hypothetical protein
MWNTVREMLPGIGQLCVVWKGYGEPMVGRLHIRMEAGGAHITVWEDEGGWRLALNEGQFWIRLPALPDL